MTPRLDPAHPDAPKFWRNEVQGDLGEAVEQYLADPDAMTIRDIALMRLYIRQWVMSPVWDANPAHDDESRVHLASLRVSVDALYSPRSIRLWIHEATAIGIDPL